MPLINKTINYADFNVKDNGTSNYRSFYIDVGSPRDNRVIVLSSALISHVIVTNPTIILDRTGFNLPFNMVANALSPNTNEFMSTIHSIAVPKTASGNLEIYININNSREYDNGSFRAILLDDCNPTPIVAAGSQNRAALNLGTRSSGGLLVLVVSEASANDRDGWIFPNTNDYNYSIEYSGDFLAGLFTETETVDGNYNGIYTRNLQNDWNGYRATGNAGLAGAIFVDATPATRSADFSYSRVTGGDALWSGQEPATNLIKNEFFKARTPVTSVTGELFYPDNESPYLLSQKNEYYRKSFINSFLPEPGGLDRNNLTGPRNIFGRDKGIYGNNVTALSTDGWSSGLHYFEVNWNSTQNNNDGLGVVNYNRTLGVAVNAIGQVTNFADGSALGTISGWVAGNVVSVALNQNLNKVWFKTGNGLWNNNATDNPETGVGGFAIPVMKAYAYLKLSASGGEVVINTGQNFTNTKPANYTNWYTAPINRFVPIVEFGTLPRPNRTVSIAFVAYDKLGRVNATSATINGVTATLSTLTIPSGLTSKYPTIQIASALVPTGTSGELVINTATTIISITTYLSASFYDVKASEITGFVATNFTTKPVISYPENAQIIASSGAFGNLRGSFSDLTTNVDNYNSSTNYTSAIGSKSFSNAGSTPVGLGSASTPQDSMFVIVAPSSINPIRGTTNLSFIPTSTISSLGIITGTALASFNVNSSLENVGAIISNIYGSATFLIASTSIINGQGSLSGASNVSFLPTSGIEGKASLTGSTTLSITPTGSLIGYVNSSGQSVFNISSNSSIFGRGNLSGNSNLLYSTNSSISGKANIFGSSNTSYNTISSIRGAGLVRGTTGIEFTPTLVFGKVIGTIRGSTNLGLETNASIRGDLTFNAQTGFTFSANSSVIGNVEITGITGLEFASSSEFTGYVYSTGSTNFSFSASAKMPNNNKISIIYIDFTIDNETEISPFLINPEWILNSSIEDYQVTAMTTPDTSVSFIFDETSLTPIIIKT